MRSIQSAIVLLATTLSAAIVSGQLVNGGPRASLSELYAKATGAAVRQVGPALVQVRVIGDFRGLSRDAAGASTGVLLDERWVLCSSFGLRGRPEVVIVTLPSGETRSASLSSIDHSRQVVLLRLSEPAPPPPALEPRSDAQPGETAIGVGAAYSAAEPNVSVGVVSAVSRRLGRALQTDAAVSPVNYGGLLIDLRGRVLGVLTPTGEPGDALGGAEWYDSGIGFAVPLDDILVRLPRMQRGEDIFQGKAGFAFAPGNAYLASPEVAEVLPGGPAAAAGLARGDLILTVDQEPIESQQQYRVAMGPRDAGEEVRLRVQRGEQVLTRSVTLVASKELPKPAAREPSLLQRLQRDAPEAD